MNKALPNSNYTILKHLSYYRFLTCSQLVELGVSNLASSVYKFLRRFERGKGKNRPFYEGMVGFFEFGVGIPRLYYLTDKGGRFFAEYERLDIDEVQYIKGKPAMGYNDLFHRIALIDFKIALNKLVESEDPHPDKPNKIVFFDTYLEGTGSNASKKKQYREEKTRVYIDHPERNFISPDGIFRFIDNSDGDYLYCVEIDRTTNVKRCVDQVYIHLHALEQGALQAKYDIAEIFSGYKIIYIFDNEQMVRLVQKRIRTDERFTEKIDALFHFCFSSSKAIKENLLSVLCN